MKKSSGIIFYVAFAAVWIAFQLLVAGPFWADTFSSSINWSRSFELWISDSLFYLFMASPILLAIAGSISGLTKKNPLHPLKLMREFSTTFTG